MGEQVRFSGIQMSVIVGDKSATIGKALSLIDRAVKEFAPNIVALPELFATEYFPLYGDPKYFAYAEPIPGPTTQVLADKAREHGIYIIAGIFEKALRGLYYDSSAVLGPDGAVVGLTRKIELPNEYNKDGGVLSYSNEDFYFASADPEHAYPVIRTPYGNIGQVICYNRHFPELWRMLILNGVDVIYIPVASRAGKAKDMFVIETRALAYINQCFAVNVNRVGPEGPAFMYGTSHIVNPRGQLIAGPATDKEDEILYAALDLEEIDEVRKEHPFIKSFHSSTARTLMAAKEFYRTHPGPSMQFLM